MTMLVRTATEPVPGRLHNEDRVFHHGQLVGVFDGVSHDEGIDSGCVHGVAWYVERLSRHLAEAADRTPDAPQPDLLATAIAAVNISHEGRCDLGNPATPGATVCLVRPVGQRLEYLLLSDCLLIADDGTTVSAITDSRFEQAVTSIRRDAFNTATQFDTADHAARRLEVMRRKQRLTNTEDGYWIAASNPQAAHRAVTGSLPLAGADAIRRAALLTDGASRAVDLFELFGWRELLDLITDHGPQELIRKVRAAETEDIDGEQRPRFKRHDDATVALCLFGGQP